MSEVKFKEEDQLEASPWDVKTLFQFQYFNCPECLFKVHEKQTFVDHAFDSHPESVKFLDIIEDESMTDISLPWSGNIKVEPEIVSDSKEDDDDDFDMNEYYSDHSNSNDEFIPVPTKRKKKKKPPKESTFLEKSLVQCYCCGLMLKVEEIRSHISVTHGNYAVQMFGEPQPFQCFKCNATFESKFKCDKHICFDVFVPDKPGKGKAAKYQCDQCPKEMDTSTDYRHHMIQYHTSNAIKPFECPECDYKTKLQLNLSDHIVRQHNKDGSFVCDQCDLTFQYESLLMMHVKVKHQEIKMETLKVKPHLCTICGLSFSLEHAYIKHKQKHENEDGTPYAKCDSCSDQFYDIDKFQEHILSFHPKMEFIGAYNCDKCDKTFCHTTVLDFHYLKSHGESGVSCYICLKRLSKKSKMKAHIEVVHEKNPVAKASNNYSKCDMCDFKGSQGLLTKHCEEAHPDSPYLCDKCDYKSYSKINFAKHVKIKHSSIPWYHCDQCDFTSHNLAKLKRHVDGVHLNLKPFQCHVCPKAVKSQRQLNYHLVKVHSVTMSQEVMEQVEKDFIGTKEAVKRPRPVEPKCLKCDTLCDSETDLNQHVTLCYKGLYNDIEFKCNKCDSQWSSAEALHYHLYNTHFSKGCVCDMCGRIFTNYNYLVTHKASHLNIKRFPCDQCDKKYTTKMSLERHVNAEHVQTQEYFCDQCDYKTLRDTAMRMHVKTKHQIDAFKCKVCDFASNSPKIVRSHTKKVHPDIGIKKESQRIPKL